MMENLHNVNPQPKPDGQRHVRPPVLSSSSSSNLLTPHTLDALKNLELVARAMVEGSLTGLHR